MSCPYNNSIEAITDMSLVYPLVPLGNILIPVSRPEIVEPQVKYNLLGAHWYAEGLYTKEIKSGSQIQAKLLYKVKKGDFVYNRLFAWKGSFAIATEKNDGCYVSNEFPCFTLNLNKIDSQYLWRYFSRTSAWDEALSLSSGGTPTSRNRLKEEKLLSLEIPLPPLEEQRRIVARVEELVGKVEEVRSLRQKSLEEIETLLKSEILSIVNNLLKKYNYRQLNELILDAGYGTSAKCEYGRLNNSVPVLRIPNVASEQVNFDDIKYGLLTNTDLQRVLVTEGDILVVRTNGSAELVGRCAVVPTLPEATAFASYLIRLHCNCQQIDPYYLQIMLRHLRSAGQLFDFARTSAGQYNVSLGRLRAAKIPVPPLPEQRWIVAYLDELQTKVDAMKRLRKEAIKELDALLPSILDKAFKGEL